MVLDPVFPVVRVIVHRGSSGSSAGSGFLLADDGWNRVVVTAAHVFPSTQIDTVTSVSVDAQDRDGLLHRSPAVSVAFYCPFRRSHDLAVLCLETGYAHVMQPLKIAIPPASWTPVKVCGYVGAGFHTAHFHGQREGDFVPLRHGVGVEGLSGGPVVHGDDVYAVYLGRVHTGSQRIFAGLVARAAQFGELMLAAAKEAGWG